MINPLPDYFLLLASAAQASDATDTFDLDRRDVRSVARFEQVKAEEREASERLIRFIQQNGEAVLAALNQGK